MKLCENNDVQFLSFENIEKTGFVKHGFSTRVGGVSEDIFESLNLSFTRGDKTENVEENFKRICRSLNVNYENMVFGTQIHSNKVMTVDESHAGCGFQFDSSINGFDAFITNKPEIVLVTFHADCVPLFFVDTKNKAIGLAHSGWKGTALAIGNETIKRMQEEFGTDPKDIVSAIGPSIGQCCFQVGKEVADEFKDKFSFSEKYIKEDESCNGKFKIDLWGINKDIMINAGVLEKNIEITDLCTMCNSKLFYSHRRMGEKRGSLAAFMSIMA